MLIIEETVMQKMKLKAQSLRRHEKRDNFYCQNETSTVDDAPSIEEVEVFL